MKATELKIGKKYIWRRNSSTIVEVTYLGEDIYTHNFRGHEFSYEKEEGTMYMTLAEPQVECDINELPKEEQTSSVTASVYVDEIDTTYPFQADNRESLIEKIYEWILKTLENGGFDYDILITTGDLSFWWDHSLANYCFGKGRISVAQFVTYSSCKEPHYNH